MAPLATSQFYKIVNSKMLKWLAGFIAILEDPSSESFWQDFKISLEQKAALSKNQLFCV